MLKAFVLVIITAIIDFFRSEAKKQASTFKVAEAGAKAQATKDTGALEDALSDRS